MRCRLIKLAIIALPRSSSPACLSRDVTQSHTTVADRVRVTVIIALNVMLLSQQFCRP
jgi:hypothetical protein